MEKSIYRTPELAVERDQYQKTLEILRSLEGYQALTPKQQEVIRTSLYLQDRAERDMPEGHKNDPWYYDWKKCIGLKPEFKGSLEHIKYWNCHRAIASLESCKLSNPALPKHPISFFNADYYPISNQGELELHLIEHVFPAVVHVSDCDGNRYGEDQMFHSFLALGYLDTGDLIVWDKVDFKLPYRLAKLKDVYEHFRSIPFWGIRKLR